MVTLIVTVSYIIFRHKNSLKILQKELCKRLCSWNFICLNTHRRRGRNNFGKIQLSSGPYFLTNQDNIKSKSNKSAVVDKPKLRLHKSKEGGKKPHT